MGEPHHHKFPFKISHFTTLSLIYLLAVNMLNTEHFQWFRRRQAHQVRAQQGIPVSEYGVSLKSP